MEDTILKDKKFRFGENNPMWKGGIRHRDGYRQRLEHNHPFATKKGYVYEHRLVYEEYYNCILLPWAHIHHINEIRDDNRIENLQVMSKGEHIILHKALDMSDRFCVRCGSTKTGIRKNGRPWWCGKNGSWICNKCYLKDYHKKKRKFVTAKQQRHLPC